ncbi:MAG: PH domain-containing protein [Chloroflexota bacterium]
MSHSEFKWFRSAVDWWLGVILLALPLLEFGILIAGLLSGDREVVTVGLLGCGVVAAIYGLLVIPIRYGVSDKYLVIQFGVIRSRVRLNEILEVYPTRNPLASPALSLNRLAIRTGDGPLKMTLISPADRDEFLVMLADNAALVREGDRLVRGQAKGKSD